VYSGLARQHTGVQDVLRALFGGGAKRTVKPSKELACVEEAEAATPVTCDMVILSKSPGGQWNEHLYLDRVTVCDGLVCHTWARALPCALAAQLAGYDTATHACAPTCIPALRLPRLTRRHARGVTPGV
jgi:hypothetical protein